MTEEGRVNYLGNKSGIFKIELNIFENHYFIQEKSPFTSNYISQFQNVPETSQLLKGVGPGDPGPHGPTHF